MIRNVFAGIALFIAAAVAQAAPRTITIAAAEGSTSGSTARELNGLLGHLNSGSDRKYVLKPYANYDAAYDAFRKNDVDLMLVGSVKYVQAHHEIGAIPVVVEEPRWQEAVVIVPKSSPIQSIAELKGKKFAFGYEDSTTTHLLPLLLFSKYKLTQADLKSSFLGSDQTKIVDAIASGQYDAGAVATLMYEKNKSRVRALETSERIPGGTIVAHRDIDPKLLEAIRQEFVSYKATGDAQRERFGHGAGPAADGDYNKVRFLCKVILKKSYL